MGALAPYSDEAASRDILNEKPTREEMVVAAASLVVDKFVTLHTTMGDIVLELYPEEYGGVRSCTARR
jgi:hypothetical protein